LFIVTSDPRTSHRPAEAIRIAAGVAAWKKVAVHLYLRGAAVKCLDEFADELVQGNNIERYLPTLAESATILADASMNYTGKARVRPMNDRELAGFCSQMDYTLRF
jgi:hypothetical protein